MRNRSWLNAAIFVLLFTIMSVSSSGAEKEISFKTEDGWTIYGMLGMPEGAKERVPAVIFLHSFDHDRDAYGKYLYPGLAQIISERGMATLRIDLRGRGKSREGRDLHSFSPQEIAKLYLDVRAALAFLESQTGVDVSRIGIVAEGESAEAAVKGWAGDSRVRAVVLISGRLSEEAKKQFSANP
jgi:dienelactone hydrolase